MTKRRQGKAAIATGGIDTDKKDVSDKKEQTFDGWAERYDISRVFDIINMEAGMLGMLPITIENTHNT